MLYNHLLFVSLSILKDQTNMRLKIQIYNNFKELFLIFSGH